MMLGRTSVAVSALGFGAASIGNLYRAVPDEQAAATVATAWEAGVRYFDTAPHYGLGLAERRLGEALAGYPRDEYVLSTKVGRLLVADPAGAGHSDLAHGFDVPAASRRVWDFSADGVRRSITESLDRLGLDRIDVVLIHDPEESDDPRTALVDAYPALHELRAQGAIGAIGVGSKQIEILGRFVDETEIDVIMLAGRYTLLEQPALDDLLPSCHRRGVSVINVGVFNSGMLAADWPEDGTSTVTRRPNCSTGPGESPRPAAGTAPRCRTPHWSSPPPIRAWPAWWSAPGSRRTSGVTPSCSPRRGRRRSCGRT
jgi:D-threo-aldose 1-dehydrogenase